MNPMRKIRIGKITINMGVGVGGKKLSNAEAVLEEIANQKPVRTYAKKTNKDFGISKGSPIGCKVTVRGRKAIPILEKLFKAIGGEISGNSFDGNGNFAFGIKEHIEIPGLEYDPEIGIYGMDVCVSLIRPGFRVKNRRRESRPIPKSHQINSEEAISFLEENFDVKVI
ncbi:50S ribosomal protein L5 [candidate division MSBL1 archaeon SCGC-AAA261D19]|uniref:Large ribosomal subunit protein uL5 n=4 Tax=candidate division MSBL1 TaxID=215777 RepID=A0A133UZL5_9EURY|nr:50S ribosomal protein L5 [candidate division MSBL1 archaeon SCGC-AAA261C02]KXB02568.1 50S ribosomal protein L5 [candidate division MSBL1 archaeon SCGC-AAA261D19]KXB04207.1 50S ribosomal protein L5 [candidate division MSBL1 archaeon SCGC-AAA261G05]KXB09367.1 50S ribosomal protein L5 [candidate division MSBL1 archaeon SCGC-AAA833K04]